jgi:hypothetical protein
MIKIAGSLWSGKEIISCDGRVVSEKRSFGVATNHRFVVVEDGLDVPYAVRNGGPIGYVIRRNDIVVAERFRSIMSVVTSFGMLIVGIWLVEGLLHLLAMDRSTPPGATGASGNTWQPVVLLLGVLPVAWLLKSHLRRT